MATRTAVGSRQQRVLPPIPGPEAAGDWDRPTFGEFVDRLEHEFGLGAEAAGLQMAGLGRDEALSPEGIRVLCGQLGVPAEDFGV